MIDLPNITYVTISGIQNYDLKWLILYAEYAKKYFNFGKFLIITPNSNKYKHDFIEFMYTEPLSYNGYNQFCKNSLKDYINTDYCIVYQDDGAICNPQLWDNEFLSYDYIGAPWGNDAPVEIGMKNIIGNGGFSLRSKNFIELSATVPNKKGVEDLCLCYRNRGYLLENGIKFPDVNFAKKFSVEYPVDKDHNEQNTFGFHKPKHGDMLFLNSYRQKVLQELNLC